MSHDPLFDVRFEVEQRRRAAAQRVLGGLFLIALVPVGLAFTSLLASLPGELALVAALKIGAASVLICPVAGASMILGGTLEHRRSSKQLRETDPARLLPAARAVVRER
jgi:hypothetical protein